MGENATAMRDPIFYRWHAFIDNIFQEHKKLLDSYTAKEVPNRQSPEVHLATSSGYYMSVFFHSLTSQE